jgi:hypothetical protein
MDLLTVALLIGLIPVAVVWWMTARVVRRWGRRFERHPIATTVAIVRLLDRRSARRASRRATFRPAPPRPVTPNVDAIYATCPLSVWQGNPANCRWCDRPLEPNQSRWCGPGCRWHAETNHIFAEAKRACLLRFQHRCGDCNTDRDPQVNHIIPVLGRHEVDGCHHHQANLNVKCGPRGNGCHQAETNRQRNAGMFDRGWAS